MDWRSARATTALALVTILVSGVVLATGMLPWAAIGSGFVPARLDGALLPADVGFVTPVWLTPLTATLLHGGIAHLAFNLVMLVYCGRACERAFGPGLLVLLYVVGAYAAAGGQWLLATDSPVPMIGASGAISAIVAAYALLYGERRANAIGPIPGSVVQVAWLAVGWIGIQALMGVAGMGAAGLGGGAAIAIGAHIGGFLAGLALARPLLIWRYRAA